MTAQRPSTPLRAGCARGGVLGNVPKRTRVPPGTTEESPAFFKAGRGLIEVLSPPGDAIGYAVPEALGRLIEAS